MPRHPHRHYTDADPKKKSPEYVREDPTRNPMGYRDSRVVLRELLGTGKDNPPRKSLIKHMKPSQFEKLLLQVKNLMKAHPKSSFEYKVLRDYYFANLRQRELRGEA